MPESAGWWRSVRGLPSVNGERPHVEGMHLELTDEQTEALIRELSHTIDGDRYPLSPRIASEGDHWEATAGARSPGTAAPATALRASEPGAIQQTTVASQIDREGTPG